MDVEEQAIEILKQAENIVFMTGAGVSTASGIPDYRSMTGVYHGVDNPEYLLSHTCLKREPDVFYQFVQQLYHPEAKPNVIHEKMAELSQMKQVGIVTQNIDDLHIKAGSPNVVSFHGSLYDCYCQTCGQSVSVSDYMKSMYHQECGGIIRPNVVLYEEGLSESNIEIAISWLSQAEVVCIVGTSFQVYPFSGLINYRKPDSQVIVVNKEPISLMMPHLLVQQKGEDFFSDI
ncbi:NAD-dependent protein deacylase [Melissococcus sp. OM08-11BH]|uniref:NAD-dependent protein deacylase n=1 Tax=Melissococcus sp. OM08-11BH TaxID=2293110 RepID=UPI003519E75D